MTFWRSLLWANVLLVAWSVSLLGDARWHAMVRLCLAVSLILVVLCCIEIARQRGRSR